ncbi:MAG: HD domain-containing protein [Eubacteriales bacterium]|nr:HD domain-containing protein [Eubacteriales bacterium]
MDRLDLIINNEKYKKCVSEIGECEKDRVFCHHDMAHFLDVARIAYILKLEEDIEVSRELIYAAGLLHDIGRHLQYRDGIPHEKASALIAEGILRDCGFDVSESEMILDAIKSHRDKKSAGRSDLTGIIYRADKMSRSCFACRAEGECNWSAEKKNLSIKL